MARAVLCQCNAGASPTLRQALWLKGRRIQPGVEVHWSYCRHSCNFARADSIRDAVLMSICRSQVNVGTWGASAYSFSEGLDQLCHLFLRQAAGMPPDQGRTRAPRASPVMTASAESSGRNSNMHCAMILTVSRPWRAVSLLSSAASAGSTGSSKHQSCSGISAGITRSSGNS